MALVDSLGGKDYGVKAGALLPHSKGRGATLPSSGQALKVAATKEAELALGFFAAEIEGHEDLYGDATAAVVEFVDADDFAQGFLIDRARFVGIGKGDEDAQAFLIFLVLGDEVHAVLRGVLSGKDFVEIGETGFGRAHANYTGKLQTTFAAAFFCCQAGHGSL